MKIAIIGAGFCGLSACYYLSKHTGFKVSVFDKKGLGGGASGIAAGLLHPFVGKEAKLNWRGLEGYQAAKELLQIASQELGRAVYSESGVLRLALSNDQKTAFKDSADSNEEVQWLNEVKVPGVVKSEGIYIKTGISVNCKDYLLGLWKACEKRGSCLIKRNIDHLDELKEFDAIVLAAGADLKYFLSMKLQLIKGHLIRCEWPKSLPHLTCPIVSKKYIVCHPNKNLCSIGSTYIHKGVDEDSAVSELLLEAKKIIPELSKSEIIDCQSGIRVFTPERRPLAKQVGKKLWIITGMGSKGLLYHALMAKHLDSSFQ